jgi:hypothetical protein
MRVSLKNMFTKTGNNACAVCSLTLLFSLTLGALLSTCNHADTTDQAAKAKPVLTASPNPVPAGDLDQPLAATQISWNTGNKTIGELYVRVNRSPERLLGRGPSGTIKIGWIQFDSTYEFRLYAKKHSRLLAKLDVTRDN